MQVPAARHPRRTFAALVLVLLGVTAFTLPEQTSGPGRHLVAFGDSVPTGATCTCPNEVTLLGQRLSTRQGSTVPVSNLAVNGATTATVLTQVRKGQTGGPSLRVSTITVGANDFDASIVTSPACDDGACYRDQLHITDGRVRAILSALLREQGNHVGASDPIALTGYWNVFQDGAVGRAHGAAYVENSAALTRALNAVLRRAATLYGARYVDLYAPFKGDGSLDDTALLGSDGDHPNARGHRLIAAVVARSVP